jgi:hypothetical protein
VGGKLTGPHQLMIYVDTVSLLGKNINSMNKTAYLLVASKKIGLEVNSEYTKHMFTFREQNAGQNHNTKQKINPLKMWLYSNTSKRL